jgi:hypothetical protein
MRNLQEQVKKLLKKHSVTKNCSDLSLFEYRTRTIITRSWFETTLDYKIVLNVRNNLCTQDVLHPRRWRTSWNVINSFWTSYYVFNSNFLQYAKTKMILCAFSYFFHACLEWILLQNESGNQSRNCCLHNILYYTIDVLWGLYRQNCS